MKRTAISLFVCVAIGGWASTVSAAGKRKKKAPPPAAATSTTDSAASQAASAPAAASTPSDDATPAPADTGDSGSASTGSESLDTEEKPDKVDDAATTSAAATNAKTPTVAADAAAGWKDILVIPRKPFLKDKRFEFVPFTGVSINDILIQHYTFGVDLNFFLTDVFSVGLQGQYFVNNLTEREALVGLQYNRIPTLNKYQYGGALNFGYVPVYGKFALFNKAIIGWEIFASAGFGITKTEVIPRNPSNSAFGTNALTPNFGLGGRFFVRDWLTLNWALRDYVIVDKYENANRPQGQSASQAQANATSVLAHNVMLTVGVGFYLPTSFQYRQPR